LAYNGGVTHCLTLLSVRSIDVFENIKVSLREKH
jgi:hypothetical protein